MALSSFGEILENLSGFGIPFEAAVFFDDAGETIDYHSTLDPYLTRLIAAHHGVIFESARSRLAWLNVGQVNMMEIRSAERDSITLRVGEECFVVLIAPAGSIDNATHEALEQVAAQLLEEIGL